MFPANVYRPKSVFYSSALLPLYLFGDTSKSQWVPSRVTCLYKRLYVIHIVCMSSWHLFFPCCCCRLIDSPSNSCRTHTHTHTQHIKMRAVESVSTAQRNAMLQLALSSWPKQQNQIDDTECTPNSILVIYISKAKGRRVSSDVYIQNGQACICYISHTRRGRNTQVIYDEIYSCGWIGSTKISAVSIVHVSLYVCVCVYIKSLHRL
jgi:hypothetical protein